jgi:hypothetical protein
LLRHDSGIQIERQGNVVTIQGEAGSRPRSGRGFVDADIDFLAQVMDFLVLGPGAAEVAHERSFMYEDFSDEPGFQGFGHATRVALRGENRSRGRGMT